MDDVGPLADVAAGAQPQARRNPRRPASDGLTPTVKTEPRPKCLGLLSRRCRHGYWRQYKPVAVPLALPRLVTGTVFPEPRPYRHHQASGHTVMACRPQRRQRHIWAYQPAPHSSKPSCPVSSPQSRQKRQNRSGRSVERVAPRRARPDPDDQSPSAANKPRRRSKRIPPAGPLRCRIEARPARSRR
jgi:hypothetical protein